RDRSCLHHSHQSNRHFHHKHPPSPHTVHHHTRTGNYSNSLTEKTIESQEQQRCRVSPHFIGVLREGVPLYQQHKQTINTKDNSRYIYRPLRSTILHCLMCYLFGGKNRLTVDLLGQRPTPTQYNNS
ncbi:hypothetical protein GBAR_LOCUS13728, partial [Geodia barretti]